MARGEPRDGCGDVRLCEPLAIDDAGEVALEDYARVLTRAAAAEAWREGDPPRLAGVHLCGLRDPAPVEAVRDLEAFARDLAEGGRGSLGWG